jgi:hypothetical protein
VIVATAQLAPVGRLIAIDQHGLTDVIYDEFAFAPQVGRPLALPVLIDHDASKRVGDVVRLWRQRGWWVAELHVDRHAHSLGCIGEDLIRERTTCAVSLACRPTHERQAGLLDTAKETLLAELVEVSIASSRATPGIDDAEVIAWHEARQLSRPRRMTPPTAEVKVAAAAAAERGLHTRHGIGEVLGIR